MLGLISNAMYAAGLRAQATAGNTATNRKAAAKAYRQQLFG